MSEEKQTIQTVQKILPSVVSIVISKFVRETKVPVSPTFNSMGQFGVPLPEQPLDGQQDKPTHQQHRVKVGGGSGFIISEDGLIVTNKHVVYDADADYTVILGEDEKEFVGKVMTRDPINDVAILKIDVKDHKLTPAQLGDSDSIELGQTVVAVGNALGVFNNTVSKGIISGLSRKVTATLGKNQTENLRHVIQTDVAINQGNSGGPLLNLDCEVIAINTAVIYGAQSIGFAIPINWAKADIKDLQLFGHIVRPYVGFRYMTIDDEAKQKYKLTVSNGAYVMKDGKPGSIAVVKGSPADLAGIKEHDIVLEIDGEEISMKNEVADVIERHEVGDRLNFKILRKGKELTTIVTLTERK